MLVDGIVVIHVELRHRHDASEGGHELTQHASLVHPPQHGLRVVLRSEDLKEQAIGLVVLAQSLVDEPERARGQVHGVGMNARLYFCARWKMRIRLTGSRLNTFSSETLMRL